MLTTLPKERTIRAKVIQIILTGNSITNLLKKGDHSYQVKLKYIHLHLPSGKLNFATKHYCPYYKIVESILTPHDHFLICSQMTKQITLRLHPINKYLTLLETPKQLTAMIIRVIHTYYSLSAIQPVHKERYDIVTIYEHQTVIGWDKFIRG